MRSSKMIALACLWSLLVSGQQSNKVSYEGQRVASVELVANPKVSIDAYRPLVEQKAGQPFSQKLVENTMTALEKTGRFTKIELRVQPDPGGLRLTFTLEPALYFISSGVQKLAGLSSFSIDPTLGGNDPNPGARIAMQKRVTNKLLFTFASDVTSAQREIVQGQYEFNKRWSETVMRDENGGVAVDGKFRTTF